MDDDQEAKRRKKRRRSSRCLRTMEGSPRNRMYGSLWIDSESLASTTSKTEVETSPLPSHTEFRTDGFAASDADLPVTGSVAESYRAALVDCGGDDSSSKAVTDNNCSVEDPRNCSRSADVTMATVLDDGFWLDEDVKHGVYEKDVSLTSSFDQEKSNMLDVSVGAGNRTGSSMSPDFPMSPRALDLQQEEDASFLQCLPQPSPVRTMCDNSPSAGDEKCGEAVVLEETTTVKTLTDTVGTESERQESPGFLSMCRLFAGKVVDYMKTSPVFQTADTSGKDQLCSPELKSNDQLCSQELKANGQNCSPVLEPCYQKSGQFSDQYSPVSNLDQPESPQGLVPSEQQSMPGREPALGDQQCSSVLEPSSGVGQEENQHNSAYLYGVDVGITDCQKDLLIAEKELSEVNKQDEVERQSADLVQMKSSSVLSVPVSAVCQETSGHHLVGVSSSSPLPQPSAKKGKRKSLSKVFINTYNAVSRELNKGAEQRAGFAGLTPLKLNEATAADTCISIENECPNRKLEASDLRTENKVTVARSLLNVVSSERASNGSQSPLQLIDSRLWTAANATSVRKCSDTVLSETRSQVVKDVSASKGSGTEQPCARKVGQGKGHTQCLETDVETDVPVHNTMCADLDPLPTPPSRQTVVDKTETAVTPDKALKANSLPLSEPHSVEAVELNEVHDNVQVMQKPDTSTVSDGGNNQNCLEPGAVGQLPVGELPSSAVVCVDLVPAQEIVTDSEVRDKEGQESTGVLAYVPQTEKQTLVTHGNGDHLIARVDKQLEDSGVISSTTCIKKSKRRGRKSADFTLPLLKDVLPTVRTDSKDSSTCAQDLADLSAPVADPGVKGRKRGRKSIGSQKTLVVEAPFSLADGTLETSGIQKLTTESSKEASSRAKKAKKERLKDCDSERPSDKHQVPKVTVTKKARRRSGTIAVPPTDSQPAPTEELTSEPTAGNQPATTESGHLTTQQKPTAVNKKRGCRKSADFKVLKNREVEQDAADAIRVQDLVIETPETDDKTFNANYTEKKRGRRRSADFTLELTMRKLDSERSDSGSASSSVTTETDPSQPENSTRKRRRSAQSAALKISLQQSSFSLEDAIEEEPETSSVVNRKGTGKRKKNELGPTVEEIYRNKNYKAPPERIWTTVPENPANETDMFGKRRYCRSIEFEKPTQMKLKRRLQKAVKNGWNPKKHKPLPDDVVETKLSELWAGLDDTSAEH